MTVNGRSRATTEGLLHGPIGEATALTKQAVSNPQPTPKTGGSATSADDIIWQTSVVQFSLLFDGDEEKFSHLWSMRDCMHRMLNAAISEWHRADKVASRTSGKETLERGPVTDAVKAVLAGERDYWTKQLGIRLANVEKLRAKGEDLTAAMREVTRVRVKAEIQVPSSVYDSVVRFTQARLAIYRKEAFRGDRSLDSFRSGQPIRWRDGSWEFSEGERRGQYNLELELTSNGKRVSRGTFVVLPDGPSMHGFAKKMVSGEVKLCDARVVYSEKKKQWFAKLTIKYPKPDAKATGTKVAAMRRGILTAFTIVQEDGRVDTISGSDVLHFKRKLKARKVSIGQHKGRLELGGAAKGRGKPRREAAIRKIHDAEDRFVDWRCKTWAASIARLCVDRGIGTLLVAKMGPPEMFDGNEHVEALLYQWPFARFLGNVKQALDKVGVVVKEYVPHLDARRCPNLVAGKRCGHVHEKVPAKANYVDGKMVADTFECEVCGLKRPVDTIVAWNGLISAIGVEPMVKAVKREKVARDQLLKAFGKEASP